MVLTVTALLVGNMVMAVHAQLEILTARLGYMARHPATPMPVSFTVKTGAVSLMSWVIIVTMACGSILQEHQMAMASGPMAQALLLIMSPLAAAKVAKVLDAEITLFHAVNTGGVQYKNI